MIESVIPDKVTMRGLFLRGAFGNRWPAWTLAEFARQPSGERWTLMYNGTPGLRLRDYAIPLRRDALLTLADEWERLGFRKERMIVSAAGLENCNGSTLRRCCQGEVQRDEQYLSLMWSDVDDVMRPALARRTRYDDGVRALVILQHFMDGPSWEALQDIWQRYPSSVVEFTCYDKGVGVLGHNTVFWEVRNY